MWTSKRKNQLDKQLIQFNKLSQKQINLNAQLEKNLLLQKNLEQKLLSLNASIVKENTDIEILTTEINTLTKALLFTDENEARKQLQNINKHKIIYNKISLLLKLNLIN